MRAVWTSVALLYTLASLLLAQVLATPEANSNPAHSRDFNVREAIRQLGTRRNEDTFSGLEVPAVSRSTGAQPNIDARHADHIADAAVKGRDRKARSEREYIADRAQGWTMRLERDHHSADPVTEEQNGELHKASLVLRSAAPKVFGVSVYLIIAWLALMYLMYRTGSF